MLYILILRLVFHFESSELAMFMLALPSGIFSELFGFAQLLSSIAHATLNSIYDFQNILGNKDLSLLRRSLKSHYPSNRQSFFSVINFPSFVSNNIRLCWRSTSECTSIGAKEDIGDHIMWNLVQILLRILSTLTLEDATKEWLEAEARYEHEQQPEGVVLQMNFLALVMKVLGVQVYCVLMKFRYAGKTLL
jgi:hypothetical protein